MIVHIAPTYRITGIQSVHLTPKLTNDIPLIIIHGNNLLIVLILFDDFLTSQCFIVNQILKHILSDLPHRIVKAQTRQPIGNDLLLQCHTIFLLLRQTLLQFILHFRHIQQLCEFIPDEVLLALD